MEFMSVARARTVAALGAKATVQETLDALSVLDDHCRELEGEIERIKTKPASDGGFVVAVLALCVLGAMGCAGARPRQEPPALVFADASGKPMIKIEQTGRHSWLAPKNQVVDALIQAMLVQQSKAQVEQARLGAGLAACDANNKGLTGEVATSSAAVVACQVGRKADKQDHQNSVRRLKREKKARHHRRKR